MRACVCVCLCVPVPVFKREREKGGGGWREVGRGKVCVYVCGRACTHAPLYLFGKGLLGSTAFQGLGEDFYGVRWRC